jgi:hypothetical protein
VEVGVPSQREGEAHLRVRRGQRDAELERDVGGDLGASERLVVIAMRCPGRVGLLVLGEGPRVELRDRLGPGGDGPALDHGGGERQVERLRVTLEGVRQVREIGETTRHDGGEHST